MHMMYTCVDIYSVCIIKVYKTDVYTHMHMHVHMHAYVATISIATL